MPATATRKNSKTATRRKPSSTSNTLNGEMNRLPKTTFPKKVSPMLATLVDEPFDEEGWVYEIKWDGYRAVALCNKSKVELMSRNQKSFNEKFYPVYEAVKKWNLEAVVDGEICVINKEGLADFGALQNWRSETDGDLIYYVFDLIYYKGRDLSSLPLTERRAFLKSILPEDDRIRFSENFTTTAKDFLSAATRLGMEGIIAKKEDSIYIPGERTKTWLKIKGGKRHEVVIGGYTNNDNSPKLFSALLVGVYNKKQLVYTGKIGTGFNDELQKSMMRQFKPLISKKCPFAEMPDVNKPSRFRPNPPNATVTWLKPKLVCEVKYAEITSDGVMRHPSFEGMRIDKPASKVTEEKPESLEKVLPAREKKKVTSMIKKPTEVNAKTLLNPSEKTQVKKLNGHELTFTNLSKIYWPGEKITKRDMLNYYFQVAPYILPYLIDRPQSLNRYPNGINGKSFYQKDVTGKAPNWVKTFPYRTSEGEDKKFMVPQNEADLLYMANLGAIEMNPWNSTIHKPEFPTWCLIDLDPDKGNSFEQVIRTAQQVKVVLDELGIEGYPKTSGSTGIHVYIPLGEKYNYDHCQLFAKLIAMHVHERLPDFTSIERLTRNRKGKIYVDYLQNRPKATLAAPYSVRPKPGASVSMPLHWDEIKKGLTIKQFTIKNALERIKREGDIFKPVLGKGVNLKQLLKKFE